MVTHRVNTSLCCYESDVHPLSFFSFAALQAMLEVEQRQLKEARTKLTEQDASIASLQRNVADLKAQLEAKAKEEAQRLAEKGEKRKLKELARKQKEEEEKKAKENSSVVERKKAMEESRKRLADKVRSFIEFVCVCECACCFSS